MGEVKIDCPCPARPDGTVRHPDGDTVYFRDKLGWQAASNVKNAAVLAQSEGTPLSPPEYLTLLTEQYVRLGIESWTLRDETNQPIPVSRGTIEERIFSNVETALTVGDVADGLYMEAVMLPLFQKASTSSPDGPTEPSTSQPTSSEPAPLKRSKPSSISTTPTEDIGTMSA